MCIRDSVWNEARKRVVTISDGSSPELPFTLCFLSMLFGDADTYPKAPLTSNLNLNLIIKWVFNAVTFDSAAIVILYNLIIRFLHKGRSYRACSLHSFLSWASLFIS